MLHIHGYAQRGYGLLRPSKYKRRSPTVLPQPHLTPQKLKNIPPAAVYFTASKDHTPLRPYRSALRESIFRLSVCVVMDSPRRSAISEYT